MNIGLIVYEDNNDLRESIESLLAALPDFLLLGSYANALNVEKEISDATPDVVLMDIDLPGRNGIEAVTAIRTVRPDTLVLMLTVFEDNDHVFQAMCAGASGYLLKKHLANKLESSIRELLAGGAPMSPGLARKVIESFRVGPVPKNNIYRLTQRETEILTSLSQGNSYKMIAAELKLSIDTIRTHSKNIYEKLQVHSQVEAVSKAINEKLV